MKVAIVKYNAGNIYSVDCALRRVGVEAEITDNKEILMSADKIIFPGVGEAASTMRYLKKNNLDSLIKDLKQPVLGICIGMQLMCRHSEEGDVDCLNIFDVDVKRFHTESIEYKIPHMGWNTVKNVDMRVFPQNVENQYVYFVHSYYVPICEYTTAETEYILPFSAALHKDNFYASQFHIEKSGAVGEDIFNHFLSL
ncbi:imidazole glycerol phosphate synthase subunit HisH [uncultured Coprobacter sp.]|jgi:imidazole glycerol phosphate synthase, glutamine amidotransferase subunit|uniref:imidazole glycerol phosphate synthase subunit HisH n=1 Tax=uncultured Coprobacter sp. TaxID=1720550 RepID=UPI0025FCE342|nr:imidazole glycerol phosphate synthase subunit HisH [uncultured Coprobacter sp.]